MPTIIGEHPLAKDADGRLKSRIATVFPFADTIVTLPGIHATQRIAFLDVLESKRREEGRPPLSAEEQSALFDSAVDLVVDDQAILIRPDPANMPLAFKADEVLQELVSKRRVQFLFVVDPRVREALKRRGECWRIAPLPRSPEEMKQLIAGSRIGIAGREIYYFGKAAGTRYLTCHEFAQLGTLDDEELRKYLVEIKTYSARTNRLGCPEISFFAAGVAAGANRAAAAGVAAGANGGSGPTGAAPVSPGGHAGFSKATLAGYDFAGLDAVGLGAAYLALRQAFQQEVRIELRRDDPENCAWRNAMVAAILGQADQAIPEETLLGLSSEFFMQVEWLPGARIEQGELIFDPVMEERLDGVSPEVEQSWVEKSRGFIFNAVREYGDLEYVNIGRIVGSLSKRPAYHGRRDVYVIEMKQRDNPNQIVKIIRMQKWGVRENLDEGKDLLAAIRESEAYMEFILDRRLACRQIGMNLPPRISARKLPEIYRGPRADGPGILIRSPYFEREYVYGMATDKIPAERFQREEFALRFARHLGWAAAPNIIVGRCEINGRVVFDDGDEVLVEDADGLPLEIVLADHTSTFVDYSTNLRRFAAEYATPINDRAAWVAGPQPFADAYLDAFLERFCHIQGEYRQRKRAFDRLFKQQPRDPAGNFAERWEQVLDRLDRTDARELQQLIRENLALPKTNER
jgi:hypothetical protein